MTEKNSADHPLAPKSPSIRNAHEKINSEWLALHFNTTAGLMIFAFIIEVVMGWFLIRSDLLATSVDMYLLKYLIIPSGINFVIVALAFVAMKSRRLSLKRKMYAVSLSFVAICFVLYTVHNIFTATYYIFALAIVMTTIYASYRLTSVVAASGITAFIVSEVFIVWDVNKQDIFADTAALGNFFVALFILIAVCLVSSVVIWFEQKRNRASILMENERLRLQQSLQVDELTGIFNRKALQEALHAVEYDETGDRFILVIIDIDQFKNVNDKWGHHLGDRCLVAFAKILSDNRGKSMPFRYAGDEFCLLFRNAAIEEAVATCVKMRTQLNELHFEDCPALKLGASFGIATHTPPMDATRLFVHADYALYAAKEVRNTIRVFKKEARPA